MRKQVSIDALAATLSRVPLFEGLSEAEFQMLCAGAQAVTMKKGARLCEEGTLANCCFVIAVGRVKVVLSGQAGNEFIIGMLSPYDLAGEIALIDGSVRSASLVAVEASSVIRVTKRCFDALRKSAAFEEKLLVHVTATLRRATERLRAVYTFDSADRISWCLAQLARQRGLESGNVIDIVPRPSHQELAEMAGCSRETVTRALLRLRTLKRLNWNTSSLRLDRRFVRRYYPDNQFEPQDNPVGGTI